MIQLHYFPGNASAAPHIVLEEMGVPFELKYVDVGSSRVDLQACKLEYSIVSPK